MDAAFLFYGLLMTKTVFSRSLTLSLSFSLVFGFSLLLAFPVLAAAGHNPNARIWKAFQKPSKGSTFLNFEVVD